MGEEIDDALQAVETAREALNEAQDALRRAQGHDEHPLLRYVSSVADAIRKREEKTSAPVERVYNSDAALAAALAGDGVAIGPGIPKSTVSLDDADATYLFEAIGGALKTLGVDARKFLAPFFESPKFIGWAEVDVTGDLVVIRYETPSPAVGLVIKDQSRIQQLVAEARKQRGLLNEISLALKDNGIIWEPEDCSRVTVLGLKGKWVATISVARIAEELCAQTVIVEKSDATHPWWTNAKLTPDCPRALLPILRGGKAITKMTVHDFKAVFEWSEAISGWNTRESVPWTFRTAQLEDIL